MELPQALSQGGPQAHGGYAAAGFGTTAFQVTHLCRCKQSCSLRRSSPIHCDSVHPTLLQLPATEELDALFATRRLVTIVSFLDETFEELSYDVTTTVLEAVEQLAGIIKLQVARVWGKGQLWCVSRGASAVVLLSPRLGQGSRQRECLRGEMKLVERAEHLDRQRSQERVGQSRLVTLFSTSVMSPIAVCNNAELQHLHAVRVPQAFDTQVGANERASAGRARTAG